MQEFQEVRPYFYEDFYPLSGTGDLTGDDIWLAYQLHRPSDETGYIIAFRRAACESSTYDVRLSSINPTAIYRVFNKDNGETEEYTGQQLSNGLTLTLPQPRTSLLLKYHVCYERDSQQR